MDSDDLLYVNHGDAPMYNHGDIAMPDRPFVGIFKVEDRRGRVHMETDDWVDAQQAAVASHRSHCDLLYVRGTHPTHSWDEQRPRRCRKCKGWDNGSYGSQAPCGYDWGRDSLLAALEREMAARAPSTPAEENR